MPADPELHILHIAEIAIGGVGTSVDEVVSFQLGHFGNDAVRLIVPAEHAHLLQAVAPPAMRCFRRSGRNAASLLRFAARVRRELRAFRPDIVHVHSSFAGAVARPLIRLHAPRAKVVYCPHCWSFMMDGHPWKRRLYAAAERLLAPLADRIINLSGDEAAEARRHGIPEARCVVIANGIAEAAPAETGNAPPFDPAMINLLFVGRMDRQKGFDILARAMAAVADLPIRAYAIGAPMSRPESLAMPANLHMLGWMLRSELDRYYRAADAVIMPSRWEGLSFVALEAMRAGTALIASRRSSLPEVVVEGGTGWLFDLDGDDAGDLVRLLRRIDKPGLAAMGKRARARFLGHFTAASMNRRLVELYGELLGRRL